MKVPWYMWAIFALLVLTIILLSRTQEGYAPPRDENTEPPYTDRLENMVSTSNNSPYIDSTSNVYRLDNQTQIYRDMGGLDFQIQSGNPILNFIQGDPSSNVIYGDFVPNESDGGSARMYAFHDFDMVTQETASQQTSNNCPRSAVILIDENRTLYPGTYSVNRSSYNMNIYPPLHLVATGPDGEREERNYPSTETCPTMVKFSLDKEKLYDMLVLTTDTSTTISNVNTNPIMTTTMYSGYALDVNGNVINPIATQTTVTKDEKRSNILLEYSSASPSDNATQYGFNIEGNLPGMTPTSTLEYLPELTSTSIPPIGSVL